MQKVATSMKAKGLITELSVSFETVTFKGFISEIYPKELTISKTTENPLKFLLISTTRDENSNITTELYGKRDAFDFYIANFPFMSSNIPSAPA